MLATREASHCAIATWVGRIEPRLGVHMRNCAAPFLSRCLKVIALVLVLGGERDDLVGHVLRDAHLAAQARSLGPSRRLILVSEYSDSHFNSSLLT